MVSSALSILHERETSHVLSIADKPIVASEWHTCLGGRSSPPACSCQQKFDDELSVLLRQYVIRESGYIHIYMHVLTVYIIR